MKSKVTEKATELRWVYSFNPALRRPAMRCQGMGWGNYGMSAKAFSGEAVAPLMRRGFKTSTNS
jgi:hypothetical protein